MFLIALAVLLAAPNRAVDAEPAQAELSLATAPLRNADARVEAIAFRIAKAATPWCSERAPVAGWVLHHLAEYAEPVRTDLIAVYGLDQGPGVVAMAPDSPAARAGFQPGDTLVAIDGSPLREAAPPRRESRDPGSAIEARIEAGLTRGTAAFTILRGGTRLTLSLDAPAACATRIRIARASSDNAFADGRYATFSAKLVEEARNDDDLAAVVAHELAHNYLGHDAGRRAGTDKRRTRDQEAEADAFGLRLLAAAGYDPHAMLRMFDRLLDFDPIELLGLGSHYAKGPRLAAIRRELAQIDEDSSRISWKGVSLVRPSR